MIQSKRAKGRPKKSKTEILIHRSIRMTSEQWRKIDTAGLKRLRSLIDQIEPQDIPTGVIEIEPQEPIVS